MKKKLFLLTFCAIFSIAHCLAQDAESFKIDQQNLKEGKNLLQSTPTMKIYATVKAKKIIRVYGVDNASKKEVEIEGVKLAATPIPAAKGGGGIQLPETCYDCKCSGPIDNRKCKCVQKPCKPLTHQ